MEPVVTDPLTPGRYGHTSRLDPASATIADYDAATSRATAALWRHLPSDVQEGREQADVRAWVDVVVEAFAAHSDKPATTEAPGNSALTDKEWAALHGDAS